MTVAKCDGRIRTEINKIINNMVEKERMLPIERENQIINKLRAMRFVTIDVLSAELAVSAMTIRRDLDKLEEQHILKRTHGGAILLKHLEMEIPYSEKELTHSEEKLRIAKEAFSMVDDCDVIFFDSGTTTYQLALLLKEKPNITAITNDVNIANTLYPYIAKTVIVPGEIQKSTGTIVGSAVVKFISDIHVDWVFVGTNSINPSWEIFAPTFEKAASKKAMIKAANQSVLLTDSSKFGKNSLSRVCSVSDFDFIITDSIPSNDFNSFCAEADTSLLVV